MKEIEEKGLAIAISCAEQLKLNIVSVDYVHENGMKILRVICENTEDLSIDDVTKLNELISDALDKQDLIKEEYYLEVSSEGIEKELRNDKNILDSIGKYVFVKTYEKIDGIKEIYGDLISYDNGIIKIDQIIKNKKKQIEIPRNKISLIRLAVKF